MVAEPFEQEGLGRPLVVVHSSDLHLGLDSRRSDLGSLRAIARAMREVDADVLLLAGDVFDHNRLPLHLIDEAGRLLADLDRPVVILPGNHDCLAADSVYRRGGLAEVPNVEVLGLTIDEDLCLDALDLQIWGRPHLDHVDMAPLAGGRRLRRRRRHISIAHGHWVTGPHDDHRSWLIRDEEIQALDSDYLALGHWDRAVQAGTGPVPAYYSGSPDLARSVNVLRFPGATEGDALSILRLPLHFEEG